MTEIHLKDFCKEHSQKEAAQILGCTQGNVSQAIKAGRHIYITVSPDGTYDYYEKKLSGRKRVA